MSEPKSVAVSGQEKPNLALLALLVGAIGISLSPIFVRLSDVGPSVSAFYRTGLAVPLLLIGPYFLPAPQNQQSLVPATRREGWLLILAGVFFAFDLAFWHWSILLTSVANATLFPNLAPVFVTIAAWMWFGEKITKGFLLGLLVAIAGAALIAANSLGRADSHIIGDLLGIVTAVFYAGYLLIVSRLRKNFGVRVIMVWSSGVSALLLLALSLFTGVALQPASLSGWMILLALAGISHVGGQGLIAYALAHLPVSFSSVGLLVQPALAALFGYLILFERVALWQGVGIVTILLGIYLAKRSAEL